MNAYGQPSGRRPSRPHPGLGTLLGFILLVVLVPYSLDYGLMGLALTLLGAGVAAGVLAHGGAGLGFRVGARAAAFYVLLLLTSWAVLLMQEAGFVDLTAYPEISEFVPYLLMMQDLWARISLALNPVVEGLVAIVNLSFVDLLARAAAAIIPAGIGGALSGAFSGRPTPRPVPPAEMGYGPEMPYGPQMEYGPDPVYEYGGPDPMLSPGTGYECPWCGVNIAPDMDDCWNCGGPLRLPPPTSY